VSERFKLPIYLYEEAATRPTRRNLADIRRGGLERLALRIHDDDWRPDFGDPEVHRTAGASAIGARPILIAYNVNLDTDRVEVARRIAGAIRASSGGFTHVKAMGVKLAHRGIAQVSMNLTDFRRTSMTAVFDAIVDQATTDGVAVLDSEIVGLVPAEALPPDPVKRLKLTEADANRVLEIRLRQVLAGRDGGSR
jgi:glutamate formiminotransferase